MNSSASVQHCLRRITAIYFFGPWRHWNIIWLPWEHFIEPTQRTVLTGRNSDAGGDADTVVNDSEHVDVVLYACLQA